MSIHGVHFIVWFNLFSSLVFNFFNNKSIIIDAFILWTAKIYFSYR